MFSLPETLALHPQVTVPVYLHASDLFISSAQKFPYPVTQEHVPMVMLPHISGFQRRPSRCRRCGNSDQPNRHQRSKVTVRHPWAAKVIQIREQPARAAVG